jgi:hypothetical protein
MPCQQLIIKRVRGRNTKRDSATTSVKKLGKKQCVTPPKTRRSGEVSYVSCSEKPRSGLVSYMSYSENPRSPVRGCLTCSPTEILDVKTDLLTGLLTGIQGWKCPVVLSQTCYGSKSLKVILMDSNFGGHPVPPSESPCHTVIFPDF